MQTQANAKTLEVEKNCEERNEWNHIFFLQNSLFILSTMSPAYIFAAIGMLQSWGGRMGGIKVTSKKILDNSYKYSAGFFSKNKQTKYSIFIIN